MNASFAIPALVLSVSLVSAVALAAEELPEPRHLSVATDIDSAPILLAGRRYAAFWNTGDPRYAKLALAPDFMDRTLPPGRPQGTSGPLVASAGFRAAVPDLTAEMEDVVIAGDRISIRFHFRGHFTGKMGGLTGAGQVVDFQAFDIYRVKDGVIAENWHLEDNLTFKQQIGLIAP